MPGEGGEHLAGRDGESHGERLSGCLFREFDQLGLLLVHVDPMDGSPIQRNDVVANACFTGCLDHPNLVIYRVHVVDAEVHIRQQHASVGRRR